MFWGLTVVKFLINSLLKETSQEAVDLIILYFFLNKARKIIFHQTLEKYEFSNNSKFTHG